MRRILLTNDDGIDADGLLALREALVGLPDVEVEVIAPDCDRSATARAITLRRPITLTEVEFDDGTQGYATDGTPVDCVRFAALGLIEGFRADLVVSGINHGSNLGDDITYSGTVAAAWEGTVLGLPSIAVSHHMERDADGSRARADFAAAAEFVAGLVEQMASAPLPSDVLLNVNFPSSSARGVAVTRLGKRIYRDQLSLVDETSGRRQYLIYGEADFTHEPGTDLAAVADGHVSITPLRFNLSEQEVAGEAEMFNLRGLVADAARDVGLPG